MSQRITIDPVTRIEGHLRIDCEIENGVVSKAWASGTMWRGMEEIVKNRDPRDAWMIVQRICGVVRQLTRSPPFVRQKAR